MTATNSTALDGLVQSYEHRVERLRSDLRRATADLADTATGLAQRCAGEEPENTRILWCRATWEKVAEVHAELDVAVAHLRELRAWAREGA